MIKVESAQCLIDRESRHLFEGNLRQQKMVGLAIKSQTMVA